MFAVNVLKFGTSSPADVAPLQQLQKVGYRADQVLALAGKTEGDFILNLYFGREHPDCGSLYTREWVCKRLLADSFGRRVGASPTGIYRDGLFWGHRGRSESPCNLHRQR